MLIIGRAGRRGQREKFTRHAGRGLRVTGQEDVTDVNTDT